MTQKLLEQVSALADDELGAREAELLLARMERDGDLRDAWERYHLVGEAMRGALASRHRADFAARVATAIEADDVVPRPLHRALRPVAGLAIAASVAVLAVFTLQLPRQAGNPPAEVVPRGGEIPLALPAMRTRAVDFSGVRSQELQNQLRSYLLNHGEHAGSPRIRGVMPYVQIAAHDTRPVEPESGPQVPPRPESRD